MKMTILSNCTGNFQNTEAATEGFLKNFTKFIGKRLCQSLFFNKVAGLQYSVDFVKFLRTTFLRATVSQNMKAYVWQWPATVVW